ncbi:MAG TPA: glycoside hydrolase family 75 protein [Bacteroidia bacterium]|nr:glycoside hydrolase family 75 protein [Bacteroidia bacterium]
MLLSFKADQDNRKLLTTIGSKKIFMDTIQNVISFISGMNIDADGSPRAYHPDDSSGLDPLYAAGANGKWWGIATGKNGDPFVQDSTCPCPGFYISTTSLCDGTKKENDPARYVNAEVIPYFVLPNNKTILALVKKGDVARVTNLRNGISSYAIFADVGPADKIGEGSIALAKILKIDSSPRYGGVADSVQYAVFPGSGNGKPRTKTEIDSVGEVCWKARGGQ